MTDAHIWIMLELQELKVKERVVIYSHAWRNVLPLVVTQGWI